MITSENKSFLIRLSPAMLDFISMFAFWFLPALAIILGAAITLGALGAALLVIAMLIFYLHEKI